MTLQPIAESGLATAVQALARRLAPHDEATLANEAWGWGDYGSIRMALIGTIQELDDLAADLGVQRVPDNPPTVAQRLLARYHSAYWDLRALLVGLSEAEFKQRPAEDQWSVQMALFHMLETARAFLGSMLLGLEAQSAGHDAELDIAHAEALLADGPRLPTVEATLAEMTTAADALHGFILSQLMNRSEHELDARSPFWETQQPSIRFRMGRLTAHLHEHSVQIEKTLAVVKPPTEAMLHIRRLYRALAEVESAILGAPEMDKHCAPLAAQIGERTAVVEAAIQGTQHLFAAIQAGSIEAVQRLIQAQPRLVNATNQNRISGVSFAMYNGQAQIAHWLREAGTELDLFDAAIMGDLNTIQAYLAHNPESINRYSPDGYTPLQLACFFNQPQTVRHLLQQGADVHAVSRNAMRIQPLHAAVASRNAATVQQLIEAGADVNARQQDDFTPLQGARQNNDETMISMLIAGGATDA